MRPFVQGSNDSWPGLRPPPGRSAAASPAGPWAGAPAAAANSRSSALSGSSVRVIRRIARAMLGRAVTVRVNGDQTVEGIVTAVKASKGKPRILIGASEYYMDQILTVAPPETSSVQGANVS